MGIGANIQATRQERGLAQERLAAEVGVSRQTVAKRESGETSPDLEHASALDAGFAEKRATEDGAAVNYAEGPGDGPALPLVHGQGMEREDYAGVLPRLSGRYRVFAADCFGHGIPASMASGTRATSAQATVHGRRILCRIS